MIEPRLMVAYAVIALIVGALAITALVLLLRSREDRRVRRDQDYWPARRRKG